ncbi:MAG TPA: 4-hydroxy-3-methylbut-2-enyl diphosphate reductase [Candidatus Xenobia bacterium]|jgi:4-hydroxy-3-methylbut-2-enyl diphosphate reductase
MKLILANPRGFCAGVARAIDIVELALAAYGAPVYVRHEIVHNRHVVEELQKQGAIFVDETAAVPEGGVIVFSAHGVAPTVWHEAKARHLRIIDATCPLVTKVHLEAIGYAKKGYSIVLIGHAGHPEVEGTMGEAPHATWLVQSVEDVQRLDLPDPDKVIVLTQTTLSVDETIDIQDAVRARFPALRVPRKEDICYATSNRQLAVKELARLADVVLVIGAANSSNSKRLVEVALAAGTRSYLIARAADIDSEWLSGAGCVGLSAGASAPEVLVQEVVRYLQGRGATEIEDLTAVEETMTFNLPRALAETVRTKGVGAPILERHAAHR